MTIAAMTSVQNVFVFGEGAAGAMGEIERRKFTAEEGVSSVRLRDISRQSLKPVTLTQDHLTLLNGMAGNEEYVSRDER